MYTEDQLKQMAVNANNPPPEDKAAIAKKLLDEAIAEIMKQQSENSETEQ